MKTRLLSLASLVLALVASRPAGAVVLELVPATQTGAVGDAFDVDIFVSGLGAGAAPSVGDFDFDVTYDPAILAPTAVTFGAFLGDPLLFEVLSSSSAGGGVVDLAAVSLLPPAALDALQPAAFVLATLSFDAVGLGTSPLAFTQTLMGDGLGGALSVAASGGSIRVVDARVPEPGAALLVVLGLLASVRARPYRGARRNQNGPRRLGVDAASTSSSTVQK